MAIALMSLTTFSYQNVVSNNYTDVEQRPDSGQMLHQNKTNCFSLRLNLHLQWASLVEILGCCPEGSQGVLGIELASLVISC